VGNKAIKREIEAVTDQTCEPCKTAKEDVPAKLSGLEHAEFKDVDYFSERGKELEKEAGSEFKGTPYFKDCLVNEDGTKSCRTFTGYSKEKSFAKLNADNYLTDLEVDG
jgi:hypothetical protein